MASNYTSNYHLCQWEADDKVLRTEFNEDNVKIEAALSGLERSKAPASELNALSAVVAGKAEQTALESLSQTAIAELEKRNCCAYFANYTGDSAGYKTFALPGKPWMIILVRKGGYAALGVRDHPLVIGFYNGNFPSCAFSWSGNSVSIDDPSNYFTLKAQVYTIFALYEP